MGRERSLAGCSPWGRKRVGHDLATKQSPQEEEIVMFKICLVPRIQNRQSNFEFHFPQTSFQIDTLVSRFVRKKPSHQLCLLPSGMSGGWLQGWRPPQCGQTISLVPKEEAGAGSAGRHEVTTFHRPGLHLSLSGLSQGPGGGRTQLQRLLEAGALSALRIPLGLKKKNTCDLFMLIS